jgi:hypothetical protein
VQLPYLEHAYIPEAKIVKYLLNIEHTGGGREKAIFLMSFGFTLEAWRRLEAALLAHAAAYEVASTADTDDGVHYVIEGRIETPDGRNPELRAVWALDTDSTAPRFITAYRLR